MKIAKQVLAIFLIITIVVLSSCASKPKVKIVEMENKGTSMNVAAPDWIKIYTANGISRVQAQSEFKDKYCVIGEESGVNRQFVLAWADNFSAQQRIGAMLRTNIASEYQARVQGIAQSTGGANSSTAAGGSSGEYSQEIKNIITAIVNVSYSGAQREADWWSLRRRYDPDQKGVFSDEYTAYVLYTIPKAELNRQVAQALETSVSKDSMLYDITINMAKQILQNGLAQWGAGETSPSGDVNRPTQAAVPASPTSPVAVPAGAPQNGTYLIQPRVRAHQAGVAQNLWVDRVMVRDGFLTVYFTGSAVGKGGDGDFPPFWSTSPGIILLTNLDRTNQIFGPVSRGEDDDGADLNSTNGFYLTFQGVNFRQFSLTSTSKNPPIIFDRIVLTQLTESPSLN